MGMGRIEVRGDDFDAVLLIDGQPILMHWHDCSGSIMQYLLAMEPTPDLNNGLSEMHHFLNYGWHESMPIEPQILPILKLFANGTYTLMVEDARDIYFDDLDIPSEYHTYPCWAGTLFTTLATSKLNQDAVELHSERISAGHRPCVIATARFDMETEIFCRYVIDGHHKLAAYQKLGIIPRLCTIVHQAPPKILASKGREYTRRSQWHSHYKKFKGKII